MVCADVMYRLAPCIPSETQLVCLRAALSCIKDAKLPQVLRRAACTAIKRVCKFHPQEDYRKLLYRGELDVKMQHVISQWWHGKTLMIDHARDVLSV